MAHLLLRNCIDEQQVVLPKADGKMPKISLVTRELPFSAGSEPDATNPTVRRQY